MGNLFSSKSLFSAIFGNVANNKYFTQKTTVRPFSEMDYARIARRPGGGDVNVTMLSRYDKDGRLHKVAFEENFAKILKEAEMWSNLESESECEGLNLSSEEEAVVDQKWLSWRTAQKTVPCQS